MSAQDQSSGRRAVNGALRGSFRSVHLGWTDPVTGERLTVETSADSGYLAGLQSRGFERIARAGPGSDRRVSARARATGARSHPEESPDARLGGHSIGGNAIAG